MRVIGKGRFVRVSVSKREVARFKLYWPASGIPSRAISFTFDKRNGDLVDIWPHTQDMEQIGGGAMNALAEDARNYLSASMFRKLM